jgi:hypothetical protein
LSFALSSISFLRALLELGTMLPRGLVCDVIVRARRIPVRSESRLHLSVLLYEPLLLLLTARGRFGSQLMPSPAGGLIIEIRVRARFATCEPFHGVDTRRTRGSRSSM